MVFARQVYGYGKEGDVLVAFSTSGNSLNVFRAIQTARIKELKTIGLTGRDGGRMKELCAVAIRIPKENTPEIQELHLPVYHSVCRILEEFFFSNN